MQVGIGYYQNAYDGAGVYFDDMASYIGDTKITINVNTAHIQGITPSLAQWLICVEVQLVQVLVLSQIQHGDLEQI